MKTILLLRHAKSDWGDSELTDFDRPLAKRGLNDAPLMGEVLKDFAHVPDLILSSPALRAKQTAELAAEACGYKKSIQWVESFYMGGCDDTLAILQKLPDTVERVLYVGHNPTLEELAATLLSADMGEEWRDEWAVRIPTAGLICLDINVLEWATLEPGEAVLRWFLIPKLVKAIMD
jgi:phosphohistidine phosphatase